jgi:RNA polymerase sigma factor (sigma-70 family)
MHKLGIHDPDGEFYSEGMYAMWQAYKKYEPDKGPLSTYFNYTIRYRLIDLLRKKIKEKEKEADLIEKESASLTHGNKSSTSNAPLLPATEAAFPIQDETLWETVFSNLTLNQGKWVYYAIIRDMSLKEIAEQEDVTVDAVKSWARQARKKLKKVLGEDGK